MKNILAITAVISFLLSPTLSFAHTHLKESKPAKDSVVHEAPKEVSIEFSEDLEPAMSKIEVKNAATGEIVSEKSLPANSSKSSLRVSLKNIKNEKATFHVLWKAVSKDSHTMKGSYDFTFDPPAK